MQLSFKLFFFSWSCHQLNQYSFWLFEFGLSLWCSRSSKWQGIDWSILWKMRKTDSLTSIIQYCLIAIQIIMSKGTIFIVLLKLNYINLLLYRDPPLKRITFLFFSKSLLKASYYLLSSKLFFLIIGESWMLDHNFFSQCYTHTN